MTVPITLQHFGLSHTISSHCGSAFPRVGLFFALILVKKLFPQYGHFGIIRDLLNGMEGSKPYGLLPEVPEGDPRLSPKGPDKPRTINGIRFPSADASGLRTDAVATLLRRGACGMATGSPVFPARLSSSTVRGHRVAPVIGSRTFNKFCIANLLERPLLRATNLLYSIAGKRANVFFGRRLHSVRGHRISPVIGSEAAVDFSFRGIG